MATAVEDNISWRTLVNLQVRLIESRETNVNFEKEIEKLDATKGELHKRLEGLRLSSKKETIELLLEDRETVYLSQKREELLSRQKSLASDLKSVTNLLGKFKIDIERRNASIQKLEGQCTETKASIIFASDEHQKTFKEIKSIRSRAEGERLSITRLSNEISKEKIIGEKLKKRDIELKAVQAGLERRQRCQEKHVAKVQEAILETRLKSKETNKAIKENLRQLRDRSIETNRLSVKFIRLRTSVHSIAKFPKKRIAVASSLRQCQQSGCKKL